MDGRLSAMVDWSGVLPPRSGRAIVPAAPEPASTEHPSADLPDSELMQIYAQFCAAHAQLDRLLSREEDPSDEEGLALHRAWQDALQRGLSLAAATPAGKRAKAAMLLAAIGVVLGTDEREFLPPELIAP